MPASNRFRLSSIAKRDALLALLFLLAGIATSLSLSRMVPPALFEKDSSDVLFDADLPRVYEVMTSRFAYSRSTVHPLFPLLAMPPTKMLIKAGFEPLVAVRIMLALACGVWSSGMFVLLRLVGCRRLDASIFSVLALTTATAVYFFAVPETFMVGSITIMIALLWAAADEYGGGSPIVEAFISAGTLGITVTNWMAGLVTTFYRRNFRQAVQISANALTITVVLWSIEKYFFPITQFFLGLTYGTERLYSFTPEGGGVGSVLMSFFVHTVVMPELQIVDRFAAGRWPIFVNQGASLTSAGPLGDVALALWLMMLLAGVVALIVVVPKPRFRAIVGTVLFGQLFLHVAFGSETFLYSFHWLPLLIATAALATLSKWRPVVLTFAVLLSICAGANNLMQFRESMKFLSDYAAVIQNRQKAEAREIRTEDPWPPKGIPIEGLSLRGRDLEAAYEPGGGLWPGTNTFHAGFWVTDEKEKLITTSHDFQSENADTKATSHPDGRFELTASTPYYRASWESLKPRVWNLKLNVRRDQVYLVLRGVGWRYSRIYWVSRSADDLLINGRWRIKVHSPVEKRIGTEGTDRWMTMSDQLDNVESSGGWAFARIGPFAPGDYEVSLVDEQRDGSADIPLGIISYRSASSRRIPLGGTAR